MIDRDQLLDDLKWSEGVNATDTPSGRIIEAARLVVDPDTLIITKVDGRWPSEAGDCVEHWYAERSMNHLAVDDLLTGLALLEGQPK